MLHGICCDCSAAVKEGSMIWHRSILDTEAADWHILPVNWRGRLEIPPSRSEDSL